LENRIMNTQSKSCAALLLCGALLGTHGASAQDLNRVEVTGSTPVRYDFTARCPSVAEDLSDALASQIYLNAEYGVTDVTLSIDAQGVASTETRGGPRSYRQTLRRTMGRLDCLQANAGKRFQFQVAFVAADDPRAGALAARPGTLTVAGR
jgi:hypothetical protein